MTTTNGSFTGLQAPCGRIVDGQSFQDQDDDCVVTQEIDYACGCRSIRHEYHDGSVSTRIVHHKGHVIVDEMLSAE